VVNYPTFLINIGTNIKVIKMDKKTAILVMRREGNSINKICTRPSPPELAP